MELLVFGHGGAKVLVYPTRCGRFYEAEDLGIVEVLRPKIEAGALQLFCIESLDTETFYCFWAHPSGRIRRHVQYEDYVVREVLPFMEAKNSHPCTIVHGASLGAYHAVNVALRHPRRFCKLIAFSGRYDLTQPADGFADLLGGYCDETVYSHMPIRYLPDLVDASTLAKLRGMHIVLVIGEQDPFRPSTEDLSQILKAKGIRHELHMWQGRAHTARSWRQMAALYL